MKILYHHRTKSRDGQYVHIRSLIDAFRQTGHEVDEVGLTANEPQDMGEESRFWKWFALLVPAPVMEILEYLYSLPAAIWLWSRILRDRPDFIYERYALGNFAGVLAARWSGVPLFLEVNSPLAQEMRANGRVRFAFLARLSERLILKWATKILVVSQVLKEICVNEGIPEEKLVVMHNGIHPHQFDRPEEGFPALREELRDALVIGFVGFVRQWHRLDYVLELMAGKLAHMNIKLLIVGDGPERPALEKIVSDLHIEDRVIWTGTLGHDQVPEALAAMDIALQPAATEYASPLKLFEYMAARKAIVAPALPNIREIITHEVNGLLFEPGNLADMGEALIRLTRDRRLRERLGRAAREHLLEGSYTWDSNAQQVTQLVGKV